MDKNGNLPQVATIRVMRCNQCKAYKRDRSSDGKFPKFVCKCGSTKGVLVSITAGV